MGLGSNLPLPRFNPPKDSVPASQFLGPKLPPSRFQPPRECGWIVVVFRHSDDCRRLPPVCGVRQCLWAYLASFPTLSNLRRCASPTEVSCSPKAEGVSHRRRKQRRPFLPPEGVRRCAFLLGTPLSRVSRHLDFRGSNLVARRGNWRWLPGRDRCRKRKIC